MKDKTIIIDLDSTIIDTCKSIINLHNKLNDNKIEYQENYKWDFSPMVNTKEELAELFKLFDNKDFYGDTLVVNDNVIEIINELAKDNVVKIATKHDMIRRNITREWIEKTFSNVELIFLDSFDKSSVGKCDYFIDDRIDALESMRDFAKVRLCFGIYDWNVLWKGLRVNNWLEFKQFTNKLEKVDK